MKNVHIMIDPKVLPAYKLAHSVYVMVKSSYDNAEPSLKSRLRRQVEATVREAGFNGTSTKLISVKALETLVNEKKGIVACRKSRRALEHPVTHKNISEYILNLDDVLSFDEFYTVWFENLVTTVTTNEENQRLRKFQSSFVLGEHCWKEMYNEAGIELVERPNFQLKAVKQQYGII